MDGVWNVYHMFTCMITGNIQGRNLIHRHKLLIGKGLQKPETVRKGRVHKCKYSMQKKLVVGWTSVLNTLNRALK